MRVLTFNSHQPYLHLLATSLPWILGVVAPRLPSGVVKHWDQRIRPLPGNVRFYTSAKEALQDSSWDWILAHNINDLIDFRDVRLPKAFLVHGTISGRILQDRSNISQPVYIENVRLLLKANGAHVVYISELKRKDWGIPGVVIRPGIDAGQYGGYKGNIRGVLQICNHLKERGAMMGWEIHRAVCQGMPSLVLGDNPSIPSSRMANDWEDLKAQLQSYRVYLYSPIYPYEDGYNLALLEAMATGMPIASLRHKTSPIRDGLEGVVAQSAEELREKVVRLLNDPAEAASLGSQARKRVQQEFTISAFCSSWESFARKISR